MARPTLFTHRKFRELCLALKSPAVALGSLEFIWTAGYQSGDAFIGSERVVEDLAHWHGKKGFLAETLVKCGFLDLSDDGYRIHDLLDHAPEYVQKRKKREDQRAKRPVSDRTATGRWSVSDRTVTSTPSPSPSPSPAPTPSLTLTPGAHPASGEGSQATDFERPEQPEPPPPEAAEFFAAVAKIGKPSVDRDPDQSDRRELLERQRAILLQGATP